MIAHLIQEPQQNYIESPAPRAAVDSFGQLERLASTFHHVDGLFYFTYAVCIFFFVLIAVVLGYSVVRYRRKTFDQPAASNITHNTPLEVVWTVIPLIIVMVIFAWGWWGSLDMTVVPADARQYKALAKQWNWTFQYPNDPVASFGELWLEVDKPAAFTLESADVLHAFYVPAMRVKRDVIPGRFQTAWFRPTQIGDYHLFCAEYCGQDHSAMYAKIHVVSPDKYASRPWDVWDDSTPEKQLASAAKLAKALCSSCHSTDGTILIGPSWKGISGKQEEVTEGGQRKTVTVDEAYVRESIRDPSRKIVVGFETRGTMPPFPKEQVGDKQLEGLVAYIKSLK